MKKLIFLFIILFSGSVFSVTNDIDNARLTLKNYGLTSCLSFAFKEEQNNPVVQDINIATAAFGFMGKGHYKIIQDEYTFKEIYNPYKVISDYIKVKYPLVSGKMKHSGPNSTYRCLVVIDSTEFKHLVKQQDPYIEHPAMMAYPISGWE